MDALDLAIGVLEEVRSRPYMNVMPSSYVNISASEEAAVSEPGEVGGADGEAAEGVGASEAPGPGKAGGADGEAAEGVAASEAPGPGKAGGTDGEAAEGVAASAVSEPGEAGGADGEGEGRGRLLSVEDVLHGVSGMMRGMAPNGDALDAAVAARPAAEAAVEQRFELRPSAFLKRAGHYHVGRLVRHDDGRVGRVWRIAQGQVSVKLSSDGSEAVCLAEALSPMVYREGPLSKRAQGKGLIKVSNWRERFFVLDEVELSYWQCAAVWAADPGRASLKGTVRLAEVTAVTVLPLDEFDRPFAIRVAFGIHGGELVVQGRTLTEAAQWRSSILSACPHLAS